MTANGVLASLNVVGLEHHPGVLAAEQPELLDYREKMHIVEADKRNLARLHQPQQTRRKCAIGIQVRKAPSAGAVLGDLLQEVRPGAVVRLVQGPRIAAKIKTVGSPTQRVGQKILLQ